VARCRARRVVRLAEVRRSDRPRAVDGRGAVEVGEDLRHRVAVRTLVAERGRDEIARAGRGRTARGPRRARVESQRQVRARVVAVRRLRARADRDVRPRPRDRERRCHREAVHGEAGVADEPARGDLESGAGREHDVVGVVLDAQLIERAQERRLQCALERRVRARVGREVQHVAIGQVAQRPVAVRDLQRDRVRRIDDQDRVLGRTARDRGGSEEDDRRGAREEHAAIVIGITSPCAGSRS